MSLRKYMLIDLGMLIVLGCFLEGFVTKISGFVLKSSPTMTFSLLITFVAVMRWNLKGLVVIPFFVAANWLGGTLNDLPYFAAVYDWKVALASCIAMCTIGLNVIFFKKYGTKKVMLNILAVIGLIIMDYILYTGAFKILYRIFTSGNPFVVASIPFEGSFYNSDLDEMETLTVNLCLYVEQMGVYNIFSLVVAYIGVFVLRSQGVVNNVVDKLVEDREVARQLNEAEHFSVPEVETQNKNGETQINDESGEN